MAREQEHSGLAPWRKRAHEIIFEADTPAGKAFDVALLILIGLSVLAVVLESVGWIQDRHRALLRTARLESICLSFASWSSRSLSSPDASTR